MQLRSCLPREPPGSFHRIFPGRYRISPSYNGFFPREKIRQNRGENPVRSQALSAFFLWTVNLTTCCRNLENLIFSLKVHGCPYERSYYYLDSPYYDTDLDNSPISEPSLWHFPWKGWILQIHILICHCHIHLPVVICYFLSESLDGYSHQETTTIV